MNNEIELISDGDGVALIGDNTAIERFLASTGVPSKALELRRLGSVMGQAGALAQTGSTIAAESGRWVKLTEQSAHALKVGNLMTGPTPGVGRAVVMQNGKTAHILQIVKTPATTLANPAVLAGVGGIMAQVAMQQAMDEINEYLATIDEKVDDILRAQKDSVLADMIAVGMIIDEALILREKTGRVSEVTWSKVQSSAMTIARTQAYAVRQLDALAEKLEGKSNIVDLAKASTKAQVAVQEWLAVLARCFQLQEASALLELDRVMDGSPEDLDQHRVGLRAARDARRELISRATAQLIVRMNASAEAANMKVLLHPVAAPDVVRSSADVITAVTAFEDRLGIKGGAELVAAKRWTEAASEAGDKVLATGAKGVDSAKVFGTGTMSRMKSATAKLSDGIAERVPRRSIRSVAAFEESEEADE